MEIPKITYSELDSFSGEHSDCKYVFVSKLLEDDPEQDCDSENIIWGSGDTIEDAKEDAERWIKNYSYKVSIDYKEPFKGYSIDDCVLYEACVSKYEAQIMVTVYSEEPIPNDIVISVNIDTEELFIS
jgi:hypothetical protein